MFKAYVASLRLAVALVCVGLSLLIGGIWLGLVPDESVFAHQQRQQKSQFIALTSASLIRDQQWNDLDRLLQVMVNQKGDLDAIEIDTEPHCIFVTRRGGPSDRDTYDLPQTTALKLDDIVYGTAAFYYRRGIPSGWMTLARHPLVRFLAFFVVAGVGVYTVFVIRMMKGFEVTQIVPDRIRQALDTLSEGLLVLDERERIVLANRSFSSTVGLSQESLIGKRARSLPWVCSKSSRADDFPWLRAIREAKPQTDQLMRYQLPDDSYRFFSINSSPIETSDSKLRGALATFRDVTEFEEHRAELEHMLAVLRNSRDEISTKNRELEILATQDELTGCMNRRALFEVFENQWREVQQTGKTMACLMVDNDHFKSVNDMFGHHVGDEVLRSVSKTLRQSFPHPSIVCRYGGEEFCVIMPGKTLEQAAKEAESARAKIAAIQFDDPAELGVTVSIGASDLRFGASEPQELIKQADKCLYVAKSSGRNQVVSYTESIAQLSIAQSVMIEHFATTITGRHTMSKQSQDAIPKQTAMQFGLQIERLADALDSRDVDGLQTLASRLGAMARHHQIESIAVAADKIEAGAAEENMQWINLLRDTQLLLNLCRATQNAFLTSDSDKTEGA